VVPFWNAFAKLLKILNIPNIFGKKNAFLAKKILFLTKWCTFCVNI